MKFAKFDVKEYKQLFSIDEVISSSEFRSVTTRLASNLGSTVEWVNMLEAEIGKITTNNGEIYAKLDFEYGAELTCEGLSKNEISIIETVLSSF